MLLLLLLSARVIFKATRREKALCPPRRQRIGQWPVPHYRTYNSQYETPFTVECPNDAVAVQKIGGRCENLCAGPGLEAGANTSALGPSLTNDAYN